MLLSAVRDGCALLTWEQDAFAYAEQLRRGRPALPRLAGRTARRLSVTATPACWCALRSRASRSTQETAPPSLVAGLLPQSRRPDRGRHR